MSTQANESCQPAPAGRLVGFLSLLAGAAALCVRNKNKNLFSVFDLTL